MPAIGAGSVLPAGDGSWAGNQVAAGYYIYLKCKKALITMPSQTNQCSKTHRGYLFFNRMSKCVECNHAINASSHDRCRTHAACANGRQYYAGLCGVCHNLWHRARAYEENLEVASNSFALLQEWIGGFARNSKGRPKGVDYFSDPEERRDFERLRAVFKVTSRASSLDGSGSSIPSHRVS